MSCLCHHDREWNSSFLFSYWRWRCKLADCFECSTPVAAAVGCSRADSRAMSSGRLHEAIVRVV
jgi:hypothetical protein